MDISRTVYTVYTSLTVLNARLLERATSQRRVIRLSPTKVVAVPLDSQQSLFFFKFSGGTVRERERRTAKLRDARSEALPSHAFSHARGHLRVLRVSLYGKERLLVVYGRLREVFNYKVLTETFLLSLIGVISLMELRWSLTKGGHTWSYMKVPL